MMCIDEALPRASVQTFPLITPQGREKERQQLFDKLKRAIQRLLMQCLKIVPQLSAPRRSKRGGSVNAANDPYKNEQESVHAVVGAVINIIAHGLKIEVDGAPAVWDVLQELEDLYPASSRACSLFSLHNASWQSSDDPLSSYICIKRHCILADVATTWRMCVCVCVCVFVKHFEFWIFPYHFPWTVHLFSSK